MSGAESGGNDRLTKDEFAELIQHLPMQEMFLIQFRTTTSSWRKLFARKVYNGNQFCCELCRADASSFKNLLAHINGRKHDQQMLNVVRLYHPQYTHPKDKVKQKSDTNLNSKKEGGDSTAGNNEKQDEVGTKDVVVIEDKIKEKNGSKEKVPETTTKAETLLKNPLAASKSKPSGKTTKPVNNPVAATPSVVVDSTEDKPQYVTDKIITPTVNKNKGANDSKKPSPTTKDYAPMFSTKTYSSKPSDDDIRGMLGVEYVIKLIKKEKGASPDYECSLCELVLTAFSMQQHLEGYNHRLKYCEKHFPTAVRHYQQYMQGVPKHAEVQVMTPVLRKLAIAIEKHHGRNLPYECYESDFILHRHDILAKAYSCRHASEQYGPTFTHVIDSKEIDKYINERHKYVSPSCSRTAIFDSKSGRDDTLEGKSLLNGRGGPQQVSVQKDRHKNVIRENNKILVGKAPRAQKGVETYNTQFMPSNNFIDFSMPIASNHANVMPTQSFQPLNMMQSFMPNPAPSINFSSNNMMEQFMPNSGYNYNMQPPPTNFAPCNNQGRSVDDQTYNNMVDEFLRGTLKGIHGKESATRKRSPHTSLSFGPPPKRPHHTQEVHQSHDGGMVEKEIAALEAELRKYRKDPESYPPYNDEWQKFWKQRKEQLIASGKDHRNHNYQPEWVKFIKDRIESIYREKLETTKRKSHEHVINRNYVSTAGINNAASNNPHNTTTDIKLKSEADHSQVVSVLRLMAALEENLGSLGPKIITLLSKALQLEKSNRGDISNSLLSDENCSVIETAKEKFKGLLITGIVEGSKQRAMKKAVEEAETLISSTEQLRALRHTQQVTANISEQKRKPQMQSAPTIADILKILRAHSDQK